MTASTSKRRRGRPRKDDPATNETIRFTDAQRTLVAAWQVENELPTFAGAVHALIARGLGE